MKFLRYIFVPLYRIWFYILVTIPIVVLFPFLLLSILRDEWYPYFFRIAKLWAAFILYGMGFKPKVIKEIQYEKGKSYLFVANHTSMIDIMLMLYVTRNPFVFVGKKELAKVPLFGFFYKRTCIMVDRSSTKSKRDVFNRAQEKLKKGFSVCIFPEGGVPDDEQMVLDEFKDGAFRLAIEHRIPIAPLTFHDNKRRLSYNFTSLSASPGIMRVKLHRLIMTHDLSMEDRRMLKHRTRDIILQELKNSTF